MSYFTAKMHQIRFWLVYSTPPDPLAAFKGPTSKGRREGMGPEGTDGRGGERRRGKGRGGKGGFPVTPPSKKS